MYISGAVGLGVLVSVGLLVLVVFVVVFTRLERWLCCPVGRQARYLQRGRGALRRLLSSGF